MQVPTRYLPISKLSLKNKERDIVSEIQPKKKKEISKQNECKANLKKHTNFLFSRYIASKV